jgi:hypothetical protein
VLKSAEEQALYQTAWALGKQTLQSPDVDGDEEEF